MKTRTRTGRLFAICVATICGQIPLVSGQVPVEVRSVPQSPESQIVNSAIEALQEIMTIPGQGIPRSLLVDAEGIAIVPGMIKGGFVVGVRHGRGVVMTRDETGGWQLPQFITLTGGSVGWQAGIQATDLILVFKTKKSVQGLMRGKFTIGGDASAAAGPVGRDAAVATDAALKAEIYSYSRSRGLFAGVALDGSALQVDAQANANYYRQTEIVRPQTNPHAGQGVPIPASAANLLAEIGKYTSSPTAELGETAEVQIGPAVPDLIAVQRELATSSRRLSVLLDDRWKGYLALPAEVYGEKPVPAEGLAQAVARFQTVAGNPQYRALAQCAEFQETLQLLRHLIALQPRPALALPPPPQ